MFKVECFDSWKAYDGASEGSGRSEKEWLISESGEIGLFKYPKFDPKDQKETTEHISEHLAHQLGCVLNIPTARVDIGVRGGRIGSMSYLVRSQNQTLVEGITFISGKYPKFSVETLKDEETGIHYCVEHIFNSVPEIVPSRIWIEMMLFDFLIGNADRHQSNWALLLNFDPDDSSCVQVRRCPLYDNGSSLCSYVNKGQVEEYLGKDLNRFKSLVDTKSKSIIRIDGNSKSRPTHRDVAKYLLENYPIARMISKRIVDTLTENNINKIMEQYPADILDPRKNMLIRRYLLGKTEILLSLLHSEEGNNAIP